ncbi:MAG: lipoprotein-releasing ABC transporter permease subunit [Myxococcota bacterium]
MSLSGAMIWDVLAATGGTLALTLIIAIAVGINAMTLLFAGSAVVALDQFAGAARRWRSVVVVGLLTSGLLGLGSLESRSPELLAGPWPDLLRAWLATSAGSAAVVAVAMALCWAAVRRISANALASGSLVWLGLGASLVLGATGQVLYALAPALVSGGLSLALALRRRRRNGAVSASVAERLSRLLAAALGAGVVLALVLSSPHESAAAAGAALLAAYAAAVLFGLLPLAAAGLIDSRGSVEWFIAVRYLLAKRRQTFISIITGICVVGIAAGVWLIITVLSVMNGFERTWREEIIGNRAHFTVHSNLGPFADYREILETIEAIPEVVSASPFIDADGMVRGPAGEIMAVRLRGVDPQRVATVTDLREDIVEGSLEDLAPEATPEGSPPAILIGSRLARAVGARVGEPLLLVSPFGGPQTPLGPAPRLTRFRVVGIFESSFFQYDEMYTYVNLAAAQDFRRDADVVDGIEARTSDYYRSQGVGDLVEQALGFPFYTRDWKEFFPAFFQALKSERVMMFILLTMIMVVAAFSIVSTLVMMIMEKSSDIAILKAMGAEDDSIERIFAIEGTLIGLVGTSIGVVAGVAVTARISWIQQQIESVLGIDALPASVYQVSTLPAELDGGQIAVAVALAMVLSLGATLLPSRQGARIDPVEALRYE